MAKRNNKSSTQSTESRSPADRVRIGRIEAAIWRNESEKGAFDVLPKRNDESRDEQLPKLSPLRI